MLSSTGLLVILGSWMEASTGILLFQAILIEVHVKEAFVVMLALLGLLFGTVPVALVIRVLSDATVGAG